MDDDQDMLNDESGDEQQVQDPLANLENFGKADPHTLKVYDMVC